MSNRARIWSEGTEAEERQNPRRQINILHEQETTLINLVSPWLDREHVTLVTLVSEGLLGCAVRKFSDNDIARLRGTVALSDRPPNDIHHAPLCLRYAPEAILQK